MLKLPRIPGVACGYKTHAAPGKFSPNPSNMAEGSNARRLIPRIATLMKARAETGGMGLAPWGYEVNAARLIPPETDMPLFAGEPGGR